LSNQNKTFLSNNHGESWVQVWDNSSVFVSTKDGNFIILIDENKPTKIMQLSLDHGHTFKSIPLSDDEFNLLEIFRSENHDHMIIINGIQKIRNSQYGILLPVDFTSLIKTDCSGEDIVLIQTPCINGGIYEYSKKRKASICKK